MMPVIRISDQTWARLQKYAKPLVDTPDSVISAALDAYDRESGAQTGALTRAINETRHQSAELTPQREFRKPLLLYLFDAGGQSNVANVREEIEPRLGFALKRGDYERVSSGDIRWWNAICWERADLVREGLLRNDTPRGVWGLTSTGFDTAKKLKSEPSAPRMVRRRRVKFT